MKTLTKFHPLSCLSNKKESNYYQFLLGIIFILFSISSSAQDYILASGQYGGGFSDITSDYIVDNGFLYKTGISYGSNFITTDGSTYSNSGDYFFLKYDALTLAPLEARLIGGAGSDYPREIRIDGSHIYIFGLTNNNGLPNTIGATHAGNYDIHILKLDLNGNVVGGRYLGGSSFEGLDEVVIKNGIAHILVNTISTDFPTINGNPSNGVGDKVYVQVDLANLGINISTHIGGSNYDSGGDLDVNGSTAYMTFISSSIDLPVTDGSVLVGTNSLASAAIDIGSGNILAMTYLGGSAQEYDPEIIAINGHLFIQAESTSNDFPVTNGSNSFGYNSTVFIRYDSLLNLQSSTYLFGGFSDYQNLEYDNGNLYTLITAVLPQGPRLCVMKLDIDGNIIWNYEDIITSLSTTSYLSEDLRVENGKVHVFSIVNDFYNVTTNGSYLSGSFDFYYTILSVSGNLEYASFFGGSGREGFSITSNDWIQVDGSKTWIGGVSRECFPISNGSTHKGAYDASTIVVETCPSNFQGDPTPKSPSQSVCINGFVIEIEIDPYLIPGDSLPLLEACGQQITQPDVEANYQWQSAPGNTGPWTDIPGAVLVNYDPPPLTTSMCYRRIARESNCCGATILQTSGIHCVNVSSNYAPQVDGGGVYNTCPGTSVYLTATASGGTPPYQFEWAEGNSTTILSTTPNLTVTPIATGAIIYTITVTDAVGCKQIDQSIVNAYSADAGDDGSFCEGQPGATLGGIPVPGLPGVVYSWAPSTGLSCTNCPNPTASPSLSTQYILTLTIPVTGGGTCTTADTVSVFPVTAPVQDFAGPDKVICFGETTSIGESAEPGFTYFWAPGAYLSSNNLTPTTFDHGNLQFPNPNPITYYLRAEKQGCTWYDQVEVAVIRAEVNVDTACGPRYVGKADPTPNINETWQWNKLSGDGMFTGPTNIPITSVSSTTSGISVYELTASYNGTTCRDTTVVPICGVGGGGGGGPNGNGCRVEIESTVGCPSKNVYVDVCLIASLVAGPPGTYKFAWSPQIGLDTYTGPEVCLTDTTPRVYVVTMTNSLDPTIFCIDSIEVNSPAWSKPQFMAVDTSICPYEPVAIGEPTISGYGYVWTPNTYLSDSLIANPIATVPSDIDYTVLVTELSTGCTVMDTASITVAVTPAIAGQDKVVCNAGFITLGTPGVPNTTYSWTPAGANWQNGTDENTANPDVLVAINTTFILTTTNTISGCMDTDTVEVIIGAPVPSFSLPDINYCPTDSVLLGNGVPTGPGYTYQWSPPLNLLGGTTIANPIVYPPPSGGGVYTVIVSNTIGCSQIVEQEIIPTIPTPIVGPTKVICVGETTQIGSLTNPSGPGISYSWTPTTGLSNPNSPYPTVTAGTVGTTTYTLTISNNGCSSSLAVDVIVQDFPITVAPKTICEGSCVQIGVSAVPGATYSWTPSTGLDDPTISNPRACVVNNTTYTLVATGPTGCQTTVQVPVFINPIAAPQVNIQNLDICLGSTGNFLVPTINPGGNYTYNWSPNNGTLIYPNSPSPEVVISALGTYTYQVTVTNSVSGCATEATAIVNVKSCNTCDLNLSLNPIDPECNSSSSGTMSANPTGGISPYTYQWSNGVNNQTITNLPAGTYTVTITDAIGCIITGNASINNQLKMNVTASIGNVSCGATSDGEIIAMASGGMPGYTYQWNTGETTSTISGLSTGIYSVSISDSRGCCSAVSLMVGQEDCCPPNLCAEAILGTINICTEISNDPNHELSTIDCDGDGVTNADECSDGTDPLDPCDFVDTSITLPVIADQSNCPALCPDLTPIMTILPGNIAGNSAVEVAVEINEINGVDSDGAIIMVRVPSDPRFVFVWDIGLTQAALVPVQNSVWNYLGDNGIVHTWVYNGPGIIITGNNTSAFGFQGFYDPQGTDGQTTITCSIIPFSGGECNILNNSDSERLVYFD